MATGKVRIILNYWTNGFPEVQDTTDPATDSQPAAWEILTGSLKLAVRKKKVEKYRNSKRVKKGEASRSSDPCCKGYQNTKKKRGKNENEKIRSVKR